MSNYHTTSSSSYTSSSSTSYSSNSYNSSSSTPQSHSESHRYAEQSSTSPTTGTTTRRAAQYNNEPVISQEVNYPADGSKPSIRGYGSEGEKGIEGSGNGTGERKRVEDVSDGDGGYEERMEEEYAKREGGA